MNGRELRPSLQPSPNHCYLIKPSHHRSPFAELDGHNLIEPAVGTPNAALARPLLLAFIAYNPVYIPMRAMAPLSVEK